MKSASDTLGLRRLTVVCALILASIGGSAIETYSAWDYGDGRHRTRVITANTTIEELYNSVRLTTDPAQYDPTDPRAVPNFRNLTIANNGNNNTVLTATGGTIVLKVQGVLTVTAGAAISVAGLGHGDGGTTYDNFGVLPSGGGPGGGGGGARGSRRCIAGSSSAAVPTSAPPPERSDRSGPHGGRAMC